MYPAFSLQAQQRKKIEGRERRRRSNQKRDQRRFCAETGLIDMPKSNFGNTNDGNASKRSFEDPKLAAEITGLMPVFLSYFLDC